MSEISDYEFCGTICMAASRLGIGMKRGKLQNGFKFFWVDTMSGILIPGAEGEDQKEVMKQSCIKLADHLQIKR